MDSTSELAAKMEKVTKWERTEGEHPLQSTWAFWYDKKLNKKSDASEYRAGLHKIGSFDTVEV